MGQEESKNKRQNFNGLSYAEAKKLERQLNHENMVSKVY